MCALLAGPLGDAVAPSGKHCPKILCFCEVAGANQPSEVGIVTAGFDNLESAPSPGDFNNVHRTVLEQKGLHFSEPTLYDKEKGNKRKDFFFFQDIF